MSKECIQNCPAVLEAIENYPEGGHPSVAMAEVLQACVESYSCPGPREGIIESKVGIFRNRTVSELGYICGLPE
ncbi:MAG: hypothetical protein NTX11_03685 [Candidatus Saccharibacteria bacterium]|nr:hypothetical protein [Candidatus Saccharibacteria bacterium]